MIPIVCAYTPDRLSDATSKYLAGVAGVEWVEMVGPFDYAHMFADRWSAGETFIIIEHDVVPPLDGLDIMRACEHDWCGYGYGGPSDGYGIDLALGCTKFSAELIAQTPDLWDRPCTWNYCHGTVNDRLYRDEIFQPYSHGNVVAHHHIPQTPMVDALRLEAFESSEGFVLCAVNQYGDFPLSAAYPIDIDRAVAVEDFVRNCKTAHRATFVSEQL